MPRPPRIYLEDAVYYVTLEGPYNEPIFKDPADYQKYLELLNQLKAQHYFKLFSYALLPTRLHLLMEADSSFSISQIMQKITPLYTKYFNHRYERKGPLFQKRFKSVIVEKETYLNRLTQYLHLIPLRSRLAQRLVDYPYTSFSAFTKRNPLEGGRVTLDLGGEVEEVLRSLPNPNLEDAYERYLLSADKKDLEFLDRKLSRGFILGSETFVAEVKERMKKEVRPETNLTENPPEEREPVPVSAPQATSRRMFALSTLLGLSVAVSAFSVYLNQPAQTLPSVSRLEKTARPPLQLQTDSSGPVNLNGTVWEIELVGVSPDGVEHPIKDKIRFGDKTFQSYYFSSHGFTNSNYTVSINKNGVITWETLQTNDKGETVSWRGDWTGRKMEGMLSYRPAGRNAPQDFSFISKGVLA